MLKLDIIPISLLSDFRASIDFELEALLDTKAKETIPFDYFKFHTSISSVYSSKIEGEEIEIDSYLKHKFLNTKFKPDYTKRADDLFAAYKFVQGKKLKQKNVLKAHTFLSKNLLSASGRGRIRVSPMFVLDEKDRIEYIACAPQQVKKEWKKLFKDIKKLRKAELDILEVFYFAAFIHFIFLKIHPMQDGNGRTARLLEKWFLQEKLGEKATAIELEKNYFLKKQAYYRNIRKVGLDYDVLDYSKALDFVLMTVLGLRG